MVDVSIGGKYLSKIYCEDHENSEEHDSCGPTIDHDRYIQVILFEINCAVFYTNKLNKMGKFW